MFLKIGFGKYQIGAKPTHFVFIFHETWWRRFAESFTQKFSSVSKLPIFQKHCFFKNGPKNLAKVENFNFFFCILSKHFIGLFNGILHVLILWVVPEKQGFRCLRNGVCINLLQTVHLETPYSELLYWIRTGRPLYWMVPSHITVEYFRWFFFS